MTRLERTLLSHRVAYGIELLCVHASWMHDNLYGENHQLAIEGHARAKAVWVAIDEAMATLGANLRREEAIDQFAAEYRAERGGELRRPSVRNFPSPSGQVRQAGAPTGQVSSQSAPKLQEAS